MKNFRLLFLGVVSLFFLSACTPHEDSKSRGTAVNILTESQSGCEYQLRQKMLERTFVMQPVAGLENEIALANGVKNQLRNTSYRFSEKVDQVTSVGVGYSSSSESTGSGISIGKQSMSYGLSIADPDSAFPFKLNLSFEMEDGVRNYSISQSYNVDSECQLKLVKSSLVSTESVGVKHYKMKTVDRYVDQVKENSYDFSVPAGGWLAGFKLDETIDTSRITDMESLFSIIKIYYYSPYYGLMEMKMEKTPDQVVNKFGLDLMLKSSKWHILVEGKLFLTTASGQDSEKKISNSLTVGSPDVSWEVPQTIWSAIRLGSGKEVLQNNRVNLPEGYLAAHDVIQLKDVQALDYEHLGAYWQVVSQKNENGNFIYVLKENSSGTIRNSEFVSNSMDLIGNDTVQTDLPEIQKIANNIKIQVYGNLSKAQLILKYLKENYKYDYDMVNDDTIRPLTTREALDRKKGVCQHYAVLFAAIARAAGVPTRIIGGYYLQDKSIGMHAWNEIEIEPGVWKVVEPQRTGFLTAGDLRHYIPLIRAYYFEDKRVSLLDAYRTTSLRKTVVEPAP